MSDVIISSPDNRWVKLARALHSGRGREKHGAFLVEGTRAAKEAVASGRALVCLVDAAEAKREGMADVSVESRDSLVEVVIVESALFARLCETTSPQGIVVIVGDVHANLPALIETRPKLVVISDAVQDPGNMGTLLRLADGVGATAFVATSGSVDLYNSKVVRASMGSLFHLTIAKDVPSEILLAVLADKGYTVVAADPRGETLYYDYSYQSPVAVVFGNEGAGLSSCWREATNLVRIPLWGRAESLNVSVAAGILLYEIVRQWRGGILVPSRGPVV